MKHLLLLVLVGALARVAHTQTSDLVVEVSAFAERVPMSYFKKLKNVYETIDVNDIYRYRIDAKDQQDAEQIRQEVVNNGFQHARIVDIRALKEQCEVECAYVPPKPTGAGNIGLEDANMYELDKRGGNIDLDNADMYELDRTNGNPNANGTNTNDPEGGRRSIDIEDLSKFEFKKGDKIECLFFDFDSYLLRDKSKTELKKMAWFLTKNRDFTIKVLAHTDSRGSNTYNKRLAKNRANSTKKYLLRLGVNAKQIRTETFGESKPIAINETLAGKDSEEGRQFNRRIELTVYDASGKLIDIVEHIFVPAPLKPKGGK